MKKPVKDDSLLDDHVAVDRKNVIDNSRKVLRKYNVSSLICVDFQMLRFKCTEL